jgi:hypothetical protein
MLQGVTRIPPHRLGMESLTPAPLRLCSLANITQYETAPDSHVMATAARGGTLEIAGGGTAGMFTGVMHSHDLRHSVVSVSQLTIHGFRVTFSGDTEVRFYMRSFPCTQENVRSGHLLRWKKREQFF